jgi:hypothetical protein
VSLEATIRLSNGKIGMMSGLLMQLKELAAIASKRVACVFSSTDRGLRDRILLAGLIALIFTAGVIEWSFHYGRLAHDITYDDVVYFQDASLRIKTIYEQGLGSMIAGLFYNPPHSPYSTLLAATGFALFGFRDWVPYLMNGFTLFLFLGFLTYVLRGIPFILSAGLVILFLFIPISFFTVYNFRPDYAVAVLTGLFTFLAFEASVSLQKYDSFRLRCAGVLFGFALLSKPSFFAHTLALGLGVSLLLVMYQLALDYRQRQQETGRKVLSILRDFCLPAIALAVPYYVINWQRVWDYFWINTRGDKADIWGFKVSYWEIFKAYTVNANDVNSWMISSYLFLFLSIVIFSMLLLLYNKKWRDLCLLAGLMAVAVASLGIIIYGRCNNQFFGLTYQIILCCATCYCLSCLYRNKLWFAFIVSIFIVFTGWHIVVSVPLHKKVGNETSIARTDDSVNLKIVNAINNLRKFDSNSAPSNVFVSFTGKVNAYSMQWLAIREFMPLQFFDLNTLNDMDAYKKAISESDFIVVADEDAADLYHWLPFYTIQKQVLDFIRVQPALEEIMILKTSSFAINGDIRIFANQARLEKKLAVALSYPISGFLLPEGPYPQWKLPVVRWGLYPESWIALPEKLSGTVKIILSARGQRGAKMSITLNKAEIFHHIFNGESFEDVAIPLTVSSGKKVVGFKYNNFYKENDEVKRTVLFQNIHILMSSQKSISMLVKKKDINRE